jgi:hypothetical protein
VLGLVTMLGNEEAGWFAFWALFVWVLPCGALAAGDDIIMYQ